MAISYVPIIEFISPFTKARLRYRMDEGRHDVSYPPAVF